jgi:hypothetical protein
MIGKTSGNSLRRRRASWLAGALGLLLALALIGGNIVVNKLILTIYLK